MNIRAAAALAVLLFASVAEAAGVPPPGCVGTAITRSWTQSDDFDVNWGGTTTVTFSLVVPCYVVFDTDFVITAQIRDTRCTAANYVANGQWEPPYIVGNHWNLTDTPDASQLTTIAGAGITEDGVAGMVLRTDGAFDGTWVTTVRQHYGPTGSAVNHLIGFRFIPRKRNSCSVGGMGWNPTVITTTLIDPYPDSTTTDPVPPASTDPGMGGTMDPGTPGSMDPGTPGSMDGEGPTSGGEMIGGGGAGGTDGGGTSSPTPTGTTATTTAESGGCGSAGVTPALLGIAALVAAAFPRRRRAR